MTRLYIPRLKDRLLLTENWSFELYQEYRNNKFAQVLHLMPLPKADLGIWTKWHAERKADGKEWGDTLGRITLQKGMVLTVDRIYIRAGARDYDSVTFRTEFPKTAPKKGVAKVRFWAKLDEVNKIQFEPVTP